MADPARPAAAPNSARRDILMDRVASAAGHDAQYVARVMPAGMLFVPSIGGVSHHWSEDTRDEDIALGFRVYAEAADALLAG